MVGALTTDTKLGRAVWRPGDETKQFIEESKRQQDRKRRRRRLFWAGFASVVVAGSLATVTTFYLSEARIRATSERLKTTMDERTSALKTAEEQKRQAEDSKTLAEDRGKEADRMRGIAQAQTNEARRQAAIALSRQLAAQSIRNFNEFPVKSLLLAVESTSTTSKKYNYPTPAAEEALRDALSQAGGILIRGHEAAVTSVAFSPDGSRLASGSLDNTVRVWDLKEPSAKPVVLRGHESAVYSVAFSPDGSQLASGSWDNTVRVWNPKNLSAEPAACAAMRPLSPPSPSARTGAGWHQGARTRPCGCGT